MYPKLLFLYQSTLFIFQIGPDHAAESIKGKKRAIFLRDVNETVVMIKEVFSEITAHILLLSGPVLVTAEGDAHTPRPETGAVLAHAPGKGGGGTAADPALAAEDTVTAMSGAPDSSKYTKRLSQFTPVPREMCPQRLQLFQRARCLCRHASRLTLMY